MGERRYEKINAFDALQARNDANQLAILRKIPLRQAQARARSLPARRFEALHVDSIDDVLHVLANHLRKIARAKLRDGGKAGAYKRPRDLEAAQLRGVLQVPRVMLDVGNDGNPRKSRRNSPIKQRPQMMRDHCVRLVVHHAARQTCEAGQINSGHLAHADKICAQAAHRRPGFEESPGCPIKADNAAISAPAPLQARGYGL